MTIAQARSKVLVVEGGRCRIERRVLLCIAFQQTTWQGIASRGWAKERTTQLSRRPRVSRDDVRFPWTRYWDSKAGPNWAKKQKQKRKKKREQTAVKRVGRRRGDVAQDE